MKEELTQVTIEFLVVFHRSTFTLNTPNNAMVSVLLQTKFLNGVLFFSEWIKNSYTLNAGTK